MAMAIAASVLVVPTALLTVTVGILSEAMFAAKTVTVVQMVTSS